MKQITREIKQLNEEIYLLISDKYKLEKPSLKIVHYPSGTFGCAHCSTNSIRINSSRNNLEKLRKTLIHEYCHIVNHVHFNKHNKKKLGHNTKFWELCLEFGLTHEDYGYGLTNTMRQAYKNLDFNIGDVK